MIVAGCNYFPQHRQGISVLALVDYSQSSQVFHPEYQRTLKQLIEALPPHSHLIVGRICENTEAKFIPEINLISPGWDSKLSEMTAEKPELDEYNQQKIQYQAQIDSSFKAFFAQTQFSQFTDVLSSLRIASEVFPQAESKRVLVFLSDMLHDTPELNLERAALDESNIDQVTNQLIQQKRIPDLTGFEIYVAGAYCSDETRYRAVREFWEGVFHAASAQIISYGHSITSFNF